MTEGFEKVQEEIDLLELARVLSRQWKTLIGVTILFFSGIAALTFLQTPKYQSEMLILMYREGSVPDVPDVPGLESRDTPKTKYNQDLSTEINILKSHSLVARAMESSGISFESSSESQLPSKSPSEIVLKNISIRQPGDADVLIVLYQDTDPTRAQAVLEALGSTYINYSIERQRSQASSAIQFIDEQLPEAQQKLDETTSSLRSFQERYEIVEPETYATEISELRQHLLEREQEVRIDLSRTQRKAQELRQQLKIAGQVPETTVSNSILSQDPYYQELALKLTELESELASERAIFKETDPSVQQLIQQRNQIKSLLQERTQSILGSATTQINSNEVIGYGETYQDLTEQLLKVETDSAALESQLEAIRQSQADIANQFQQFPQLQQIYAELQRQLEVRAEAVNSFLKTRQELRIAEAQEIAPWEIIESPYLPEVPVSPNVKRNLALGLFAGGLLGMGAALLMERLNQRVKQVKTLKQLTGLSLLGTIPKTKQRKLIAVGKPKLTAYQQHIFAESFRTLALNLRYLGSAMDRIKVLAFTSAVPGEGKTTITYQLGIVLAELGHRVLVVDANLRQSALHLLANLPNEIGLSTVLTTDNSWNSAVYSGELQGLDFISSGSPPSNSVALLNSERMRQLIHQWRQIYDYVLVDTPAVIGAADAQSIGSYVDSVIFVSRMECATSEEITYSLEILRNNHCTLAGVIANSVSKKHGYSYSHQVSVNRYRSRATSGV